MYMGTYKDLRKSAVPSFSKVPVTVLGSSAAVMAARSLGYQGVGSRDTNLDVPWIGF